MPSSFTLFEILNLIGLSQGLITALLLLTSKDKLLSKRILGVTVLVFCVAICRPLLHSTGLWNTLTFRYLPVGMELLLPPLVYLYVLALTERNFKLQWSHAWHFALGILYAVYDISLYVVTRQYDTFAEKHALANAWYFNQLNAAEDYMIVILTLVYLFLGIKKMTAFVQWLQQFKGYQTFPIYGWLKAIIKWSALLGAVLMTNEMLDTLNLTTEIKQERWRFFNLFLAFMTYYLGFMGYRQDGLKVHEAQTQLSSRANKLSTGNNPQVKRKLLALLDDDAIYLEPALTIKQLAADLGITVEALSLIINQRFDMSFRDLLNSYRVNHFKKLVADHAGALPSVLSLALDSGFNSQASFYRAFKKFEGQSPKAFIDNLS